MAKNKAGKVSPLLQSIASVGTERFRAVDSEPPEGWKVVTLSPHEYWGQAPCPNRSRLQRLKKLGLLKTEEIQGSLREHKGESYAMFESRILVRDWVIELWGGVNHPAAMMVIESCIDNELARELALDDPRTALDMILEQYHAQEDY